MKRLGLQCRDGIVQVRWRDPNLSSEHTTHAIHTTVLILVTEEEALRVRMNVDILLGGNRRKQPDVQLHAVRAFMDTFTPSLLPEVQPDDLSAGSVAEVA